MNQSIDQYSFYWIKSVPLTKTRFCEKIGDLSAEEVIQVKSVIKEMLVD